MQKQIYLVVTPFFPSPESWRGAYCYDFVNALMKSEKYDVRVFVPGSGSDYDYQGVHVVRFKVKMLPSAVLPFLFSKWNQRSFLEKLREAKIDICNIAVCHGHSAFLGIYPLAVKKLNQSCLTLLHHHDLGSFGLNIGRLRHIWLFKAIQYFLLRRVHEQMDVHVFISKKVRQSFLSVPNAQWTTYVDYLRQMRGLRWLRGPKIKGSLVLYNGVDTAQFHTLASEKSKGSFVIGCVANFNEGKDQITLLRAVALLRDEFPEIQLRFMGSGEDLKRCQAFAKRERLNAEFLTEVDHGELPRFYYGLDLFVLPSYWDGFGCVFTEAWHCGVPFIACDSIGIAELIPEKERKQWLFRQQDVNGLADCIRNYFIHRPQQCLLVQTDEVSLVDDFVKEIDKRISDLKSS
ncbi:MAG: glycosyltransferase family 4 protein [Bacteroidaceae bacterium]